MAVEAEAKYNADKAVNKLKSEASFLVSSHHYDVPFVRFKDSISIVLCICTVPPLYIWYASLLFFVKLIDSRGGFAKTQPKRAAAKACKPAGTVPASQDGEGKSICSCGQQ